MHTSLSWVRHALAFDTGTDPAPLIEYLEQHQLVLDALYITHRHHDHIAGIQTFRQNTHHLS